MSYVHKWLCKDSRYLVINGTFPVEFKTKQDAEKYANDFGNISQRYTDQQLELEAQGWTLWNAGDDAPDIAVGLLVDIHGGEDYSTHQDCGWFHWGSNMGAIAYRLSNADGYKEGVRIDIVKEHHKKAADFMLNGKESEWKTGELPPVGAVCEISDSDEIMHKELSIGDQVTIIAHYKCNGFDVAAFTFAIAGGLLVDSAMKDYFRPTQSERDKVIAKAMDMLKLVVFSGDFDVCDEFIQEIYEKAYNAGMLSMPDKGEEQ